MKFIKSEGGNLFSEFFGMCATAAAVSHSLSVISALDKKDLLS